MSTSPFPSPASVSDPHIGSATLDAVYPSASVTVVPGEHLFGWSNSLGKRVFDLAVCVPMAILLFPLMALLAVLVKLSSRGPAFFLQTRMGKNQVPFTIYKYRTMHASDDDATSVTRRGDNRLTGVGKILRRAKLDELPQLFNVLKGDMSLVGPRPKVLGHDKYTLPCRPGITGKATLLFKDEEELLSHLPQDQVVHFAVEVLNPIKAQLDYEYALRSTLTSDLAIVLATGLRIRREATIRSLDHLTERFPEAFAAESTFPMN